MQFDYPPIEGADADIVFVSHEHGDHNAVEVVGGSPQVLRSTAGTLDSPIGEVVAVASEHDDVAGTKRGPNTIFRFTLDGLRICHFGDLGQAELRSRRGVGGRDRAHAAAAARRTNALRHERGQLPRAPRRLPRRTRRPR